VAEVLARQESDWDRGERPLVEELLAAHPTFAESPNAVLELICNEVVLREEHGERPSLSEYRDRFPELAEPLRVQWEVDRALFSRRSAARAGGTVARPPLEPGATVARPRDGAPAGTVAQSPDQRAKVDADAPRARRGAAGHPVGRYRVEAVLGRGGMGVAYRAWDPDLKRLVAVKMLRAADADESEIARFRIESEAIARVRHPNIVQVFDVGEEAGQPFFAMEYCAGGSLAGRLKTGPFAPTEAAGVVEQIARGVDAAHKQNIVHRDLKPANVLLSHDPTAQPVAGTSTAAGGATAPGSSASGSPAGAPAGPGPVVYKVTDFGLAKALDADEGYTRSGAILGTPCYMSPEQAFGQGSKVGPAADVYALGAILYECLTGRPPFQGATVPDTLDQVRAREPVPVRQLQPAVPVDLETIALKCLQKDAAKRYPSAADAADDLRRYLDGRPILARPVGAAERAWRWCRRNKLVAGLIAGVFAVFALGLTGTTIMWRRAVANATEEQIQRGKAEASRQKAFDAVNESFIKVSEDKQLQAPHMRAVRKALLSAARPYFESFVADRRDDPKAKRELAVALTRLALVSELSDAPDAAVRRWREIVPYWEALLTDGDNTGEARFELAKVCAAVGLHEHRAGQYVQAEAEFDAAVAHLRAQPERAARDPAFPALEARCLAHLASAALARGDAPRAAALHRDALERHARAALHGDTFLVQLDRAELHALRGDALLRAKKYDDAATEYLAAEKVYAPVLASATHERTLARRGIAAILAQRGVALWRGAAGKDEDRIADAEIALGRAYWFLEDLVKEAPDSFEDQCRRADSEFYIAAIALRKLGDVRPGAEWSDAQHDSFDAAIRLAPIALEHRKWVLKTNPNDAGVLADVAESYAQVRDVARLKLVRAQPALQAQVAAELAARTGEELDFLEAHHANPRFAPALVANLPFASAARAQLLSQLGRADEARAEWDRAIRFAPPNLKPRFERDRDAKPPAPKKKG
jgi:tetratricopeptide (TPR) repeat protein